MYEATITGFMNSQRAQNEAGSSSIIPNMNSSNTGANIQASVTVNRPAQMGGQNSNNRDDTSQILHGRFGEIIS